MNISVELPRPVDIGRLLKGLFWISEQAIRPVSSRFVVASFFR